MRRGDGIEASVKRSNSWISHPPSSSDFNAERDIVKLRTGFLCVDGGVSQGRMGEKV